MTNIVVNNVAYLRTSREFPKDVDQLNNELNKSYIDTANAINTRTIGLFPTNRAAITGEQWYIAGTRKQQGFRQVYRFSDSNLTINHGLDLKNLTNFVRIWGTFFDGTNWQALPYINVVAANNQITVMVNATQIVVTKGAGAPPTISDGLIVLEWISDP